MANKPREFALYLGLQRRPISRLRASDVHPSLLPHTPRSHHVDGQPLHRQSNGDSSAAIAYPCTSSLGLYAGPSDADHLQTALGKMRLNLTASLSFPTRQAFPIPEHCILERSCNSRFSRKPRKWTYTSPLVVFVETCTLGLVVQFADIDYRRLRLGSLHASLHLPAVTPVFGPLSAVLVDVDLPIFALR